MSILKKVQFDGHIDIVTECSSGALGLLGFKSEVLSYILLSENYNTKDVTITEMLVPKAIHEKMLSPQYVRDNGLTTESTFKFSSVWEVEEFLISISRVTTKNLF